MTDQSFDTYLEALQALEAVGQRQADATSRAIADSEVSARATKTRLQERERSFDRARRDALEAEGLLTDLFSILGSERRTTAPRTPASPGGTQFAQLQAEIRDITQWTVSVKPTAESLLRTRARLAKAVVETPPPTPELPSAPPPPPTPPPRRFPTGIAIVIALIVIAVVVVIVVIVAL